MSFVKRKKHPANYRPDAWLAQKMPAQTQSVVAAEPAPVVVKAKKKKRAKR